MNRNYRNSFELKLGTTTSNDKSDEMETSSVGSDTVISDLNDDCLLEVFKYLDLENLLVAGDVCRRFRLNARSHFALKFKEDRLHIGRGSLPYGHLYLSPRNKFVQTCSMRGILRLSESLKAFLPRVSQILRLFGSSIKFIKLGGTCKNRPVEIFAKGQRIILDLVSRYCSGTLIELNISQCDLTGEIEITIRPLLLHLQKLIISECRYSQLFGQMLSKWSPNLRESQFSYDFI